MRRLLVLLAAAIVPLGCLAGCATTAGHDYQRPALNPPAQHRGQTRSAEAASLADQAWWDVFHDDVLKGLIAEALRNGYDVRLAAWRVEEVRANAGVIRAQSFPSFQGQVEAGYGRVSEFSSGNGAQGAL